MKRTVYPVYIHEDKNDPVPFYVYAPDFDRGTQGVDFAEALEMAEDLINELVVSYEDAGIEVPAPSAPEALNVPEGDFEAWIVCDPEDYKRRTDNRAVRKNVSLPAWLNTAAEKAGLSFSAVLQEGLKEALGIAK